MKVRIQIPQDNVLAELQVVWKIRTDSHCLNGWCWDQAKEPLGAW